MIETNDIDTLIRYLKHRQTIDEAMHWSADSEKEKEIIAKLVQIKNHYLNRQETGYLVSMSPKDYKEWKKYIEFKAFQQKTQTDEQNLPDR